MKKYQFIILCFLFAGPGEARAYIANISKSIPNSPLLAETLPSSEENLTAPSEGESSSSAPSSPLPPPQEASSQDSWETEPMTLKQEKFRRKKWGAKSDKSRLALFRWLNEQNISFQWAYAILEKKQKYAPTLLKEKINENFKNDTLLYLNFYQNVVQFPYVLKWGFKASAGFTRNEDIESLSFFPLSLSVITSLQLSKHQFIVPFFEMGYSIWTIDFSDFSQLFPFWGVGALISFSLFKPSLRHTMLDEYGIRDVGINMEFRNNSSPMEFFEKDRGYFLRSIHLGVYFHF